MQMQAEQESFCVHCGTAPCSHPDMGAALAMAQADRNGRWAVVASVLALLMLLVALACATEVI